MAEATKSLEEQLQEQKESLEDNIRQTEAQMGRLKEQYLRFLVLLNLQQFKNKKQKALLIPLILRM